MRARNCISKAYVLRCCELTDQGVHLTHALIRKCRNSAIVHNCEEEAEIRLPICVCAVIYLGNCGYRRNCVNTHIQSLGCDVCVKLIGLIKR